MIEINVEQGSDEWLALRRNYITGTKFHGILTGGEKTWSGILDEMENGSSFKGNTATQWGNRFEDEAIALFSLLQNQEVRKCGFMVSDDCDKIGASPDGLIEDFSGIEVKCPYSAANHTETRLAQQIPRKYFAQVQGMMMISGYDFWWFASYDPREVPDNRLVSFKVARDDEYIKNLYSRCMAFIECWKGDRQVEKYFTKAKELDGVLPQLF